MNPPAFHGATTYGPRRRKSSTSGPQRKVISKFASHDQRELPTSFFFFATLLRSGARNPPPGPSTSPLSHMMRDISARKWHPKRLEFLYADDPTRLGCKRVAFHVTRVTLWVYIHRKRKKSAACNYGKHKTDFNRKCKIAYWRKVKESFLIIRKFRINYFIIEWRKIIDKKVQDSLFYNLMNAKNSVTFNATSPFWIRLCKYQGLTRRKFVICRSYLFKAWPWQLQNPAQTSSRAF